MSSSPNTADEAVRLLNEAQIALSKDDKMTALMHFEELSHRDPNVIIDYYDHLTDIATTGTTEIKKWFVTFTASVFGREELNEAIKFKVLSKSFSNMAFWLLNDPSDHIIKLVTMYNSGAFPYAYRYFLKNPDKTDMWTGMQNMKTKIMSLVDSSTNIGILCNVIKYITTVITVQSFSSIGSADLASLDSLVNHPVLQLNDLREEGETLFDRLLGFLPNEKFPATVQTAIVNSLPNLLRQRPAFFQKGIQSLLNWSKGSHGSFNNHNVRSMEKTIRMVLIALAKLPGADAFQPALSSTINAFARGSSSSQRRSEAQVSGKRNREQSGSGSTLRDPRLGTTSSSSQSSKRPKSDHPTPLPSAPQQPPQMPVYTPPPPAQIPASAIPSATDVTQQLIQTMANLPSNVVAELLIATLQATSGDIFRPLLNSIPMIHPLLMNTVGKGPSLLTLQPLLQAGMDIPSIVAKLPMIQGAVSRGVGLQAILQAIIAGHHQEKFLQQQQQMQQMQQPGMYAQQQQSISQAVSQQQQPTPTQEQPVAEPEAEEEEEEEELPPEFYNAEPPSFDLLEPSPLSPEENFDIFQECIERIMELEPTLTSEIQSATTTTTASTALTKSTGDNAAKEAQFKRRTLAAAKDAWRLILARLVGGVWRSNTVAQDENVNGDNVATTSDDTKMDSTETDGKNDLVRDQLIKFVLEDFRKRHELVQLWLHEEYFSELRRPREGSSSKKRITPKTYIYWFHKLLDALIEGIDEKDRTITKLLIEAPYLTQKEVQKVVHGLIGKEGGMAAQLGISTLRDLIVYKEGARKDAIEMLAQYGIDQDIKIRHPAILVAKKLAEQHKRIEEFSIECLQKLNSQYVSNTEKTEDVSMGEEEEENVEALGWSKDDVRRHLDLYFALCHRNHDMLNSIFDMYPQFPKPTQEVIKEHIVPLLKSIKTSPKLYELIRQLQPSSDDLGMRLVNTLIELNDGKVSKELLDAIKETFSEREWNLNFLIVVLPNLDKPEIITYLPTLVDMLDGKEQRRELFRSTVIKLVESPSSGPGVTSTKSAPVPADEFMEELHRVANGADGTRLKKIIEAINVCFKIPTVFRPEVIILALSRLVTREDIPIILARTLLQLLMQTPSASSQINHILARLVSKQVWKNKQLWDGFIRLIKQTAPSCFPVLLQVDKEHVKPILAKHPELLPAFKEFLDRLEPARKGSSRVKSLIKMCQEM